MNAYNRSQIEHACRMVGVSQVEALISELVSNGPSKQPAPVSGEVDERAVLVKLCGQLEAMKRRLRHIPGTGQNESYLVADDVNCYVEEARAALTPPAISASRGKP